MPLIGSVVTARGASDCFGKAEECSVDPNLHVEIQTYDEDGMSLIGPAVALENEECTESGNSGLSPGLRIVRGREVHQSLTDSGLLRTSVTAEESFMHEVPQQLQGTTKDPEPVIDSALFRSPVEKEDGAWLNCPESEVEVGEDYEESKVGVEKDYEESEGVQGEEDYESEIEEDLNEQFESVSNQAFDTVESNSERQRPTPSTRRQSRFRDKEFKTQFREVVQQSW